MVFNSRISGRVWKFGDNISTDLIMPGFAVLSRPDLSPKEASKYCMTSNRPGWAEKVNDGDIIVAGKNFGCGSSRPGSNILKALGIKLIVADSISRIFFRNSINGGLAAIVCPGISKIVEEGDIIEVDMNTGVVYNKTTDKEIQGEALSESSPPMEILQAGGMINFLETQIEAGLINKR